MYGLRKDDPYLPGGAYDSSLRPVRRGRMRKYIIGAVVMFTLYYFFFRSSDAKIESTGSSTPAQPIAVETNPVLAPITDGVPTVTKEDAKLPTNTKTPAVNVEKAPAAAAANPTGPVDSTEKSEDSMEPKELVESRLSKNKVVMFSKSYCPFCKAAKKILEDKKAVVSVYEIDLNKEKGTKVHEYLKEKYTQKTVPYIFISEKLIGGSDKLSEIEQDGQLDTLLKK